MTVWVNVTGAGITVADLVGLAIVGVGAVTAGAGLLAGARGGGGLGRSVIGGAALGAGALLLAQQNGIVPVDGGNLAVWTILPGGVGGVSHVLLGGFIARKPSQQPTDPGYGPEAYGQPPG